MVFATFEGIDNSGKSTQIDRIHTWLKSLDLPILVVREPGGTSIGEQIREVLLHRSEHNINPETELFLFSAARAQLVREVIRPALQNGTIVLADRFYDSTTAYQGYGWGLDLESVSSINTLASGNLAPDLTLYFDISFRESIARRSQAPDTIEKRSEEFYSRVREGYLKLATLHAERYVVVDGMQGVNEITDQLKQAIAKKLQERDLV
ncbi:MAG: dTMP kinase [Ectothiorhodospiraceae bacterium]|nr:dTMP kinase [Ectothiorhodospiraceae bacterium]